MSTRLELLNSEGFHYAWVLVIGSYEYLITSSADLPGCLEAWADTPWSKVLPGLSVEGSQVQSIEPWDFDLDIDTMTFRIQPDEDDTLGKEGFSRPLFRTELQDELLSDDSHTLSVKSTIGFDGAAFLGGERIEVTPRPGQEDHTWNIDERGTLEPFGTSSSEYKFPRSHRLPEGEMIGGFPLVTNSIRSLINRKVGLYLHRIDGDTWTPKDDAHLVFSGVIASVSDDENGHTVITCDDTRRLIETAEVGTRQFKGRLAEGIYIDSWVSLHATEVRGSTSNRIDINFSDDPGSDELQAGLYSSAELVLAINKWLVQAWQDDDLVGQQQIFRRQTEEGIRFQWRDIFLDTTDFTTATFGSNNRAILEFLGFDKELKSTSLDGIGGYYYISDQGQTDRLRVWADHPPERIRPYEQAYDGVYGAFKVLLDETEGEWFDIPDFLPQPLDDLREDGEEWGLAMVGQSIVAAQRISPKEFMVIPVTTLGPVRQTGFSYRDDVLTEDDDGELWFKQIFMLEGRPSELIPAFLASIDGKGVNHSSYDVLPWGAAIPWRLWGSDLVQALESIEENNQQASMVAVITEPTDLMDILLPEFVLRYMFLIWRQGQYTFVSPPEPNAFEADWFLDNDNKAVPVGDNDKDVTETIFTDEHVRNVLKIKYNRDIIDDKYLDDLTVYNPDSIAEYGPHAIEISARNSYHKYSEGADDLDELAAGLSARMVPVYSRELWEANRTINMNLALMAPGDIASVTDPDVRNRIGGARGVESRAATVLRTSFDWGEWNGETRLLFSEQDRAFPISPSATLTDYDDDVTITVAHSDFVWNFFSITRLDIDEFNVGDVVQVIERNTLDPLVWQREIIAKDRATRTLELDNILNGFDHDKTYRVIAAPFEDTSDDQKLRAFQADKLTATIQQQEEPNTWVCYDLKGFPPATGHPYELIPEQYHGDGAPLSAALMKTMSRNVNNLIEYQTSTQLPIMFFNKGGGFDLFPNWLLTDVIPLYVGSGKLPAGKSRTITVLPTGSNSHEETTEVTVVSSMYPPKGEFFSAESITARTHGPIDSVYFTTDWSIPQEMNPAQELKAKAREHDGITYLHVYIRGSADTEATISGLKIWIGPLE